MPLCHFTVDLVAEEGQNMEMIDLLGLNLDSIVPLPLAGYRNEDNEHGTVCIINYTAIYINICLTN